MATVKETLMTARFRLRDTAKSTYSDWELLYALNEGQRAMREAIADSRPFLISTTASGSTTASTATVALGSDVLRVLRVRISGDEIGPMPLGDEDKDDGTGQPCYYRRDGANLRFSPTPDAAYTWDAIVVEDATDFADFDETVSYDGTFRDLLSQFVALRVAGQSGWEQGWGADVRRVAASRDASSFRVEPLYDLRVRDDYGVVRA